MDKYTSFGDLERGEQLHVDYDIEPRDHPESRVVMIAPHGGTIEPHTDSIAKAIAGSDFSFYCFKALKPGSRLHIKSELFDEPQCLNLVAKHDYVISVHGWGEKGERLCIGGLDSGLAAPLGKALEAKGIAVESGKAGLTGVHPNNITNRGNRKRGVQFELTMPFRKNAALVRLFQDAVRSVLLPLTARAREALGPSIQQLLPPAR